MKILIIIGSPRKTGNTFKTAEVISSELQSLGNIDVEYLFLSDSNIEFCKGCCMCLTKGENYCPNQDDLFSIRDNILSFDGVVILSPVYAMSMTALLKNFMDRMAHTMHRPRFFNQYTMIGAVTGGVGLKETIQSISQLKYAGFNIVQTFGIVASRPLLNPDIDLKSTEKIKKEARKFYKKLCDKKPMKPSFDNIMQFKAQRIAFARHKDHLECDFEYFTSKGWFDSKRKYYVENAKLGFWDNLVAGLFSKFI